MKYALPLLALGFSLGALACDKTNEAEKARDEAQTSSAEARTDASATGSAAPTVPVQKTVDDTQRVSQLSGALIDAAFGDPAVQPKQDAAFEKVFADPVVATAMNAAITACMNDPKIKAHVDDIAQAAVKDPKVMATIQKLAAGAASPADVGAKMEKQIAASMEAPAVSKSIEEGVAALIAAPEVSARFDEIFKDADVSELIDGALKDPTVQKLEGELDARIAAAKGAGRGKQFFDFWELAAKSDPEVKRTSQEFVLAALTSLEASPDFKGVLKSGLESPRTQGILVAALNDVMSDPEQKKLVTDLFIVLMGDSTNSTLIAKRMDAVLKNERFQKRMKAAIVELLSSKPGTERLKKSIIAAMSSADSKKKLTAFLVAMFQAAPKS